MNKSYGGQSMTAPLRRVMVKRPDDAFAVTDPSAWNYSAKPDLMNARKEHDAFVTIIKNAGVEIIYHDLDQPDHADAIYVFDPVLITNEGAIVLKMGKQLRGGEEKVLANRLKALNIPILAQLTGDARAEGGDLLWVTEKTLAVGVGFRTNIEGLRQLSNILAKMGVAVVPVGLPYYKGPNACLHLLSLISILDINLCVIYKPLTSVAFWQFLKDVGFKFIEVSDKEFPTMAANILVLEPGRAIMLQGNPQTKRQLEKCGIEVLTYQGEDISIKAEGGPTCLTLPLLRSR
jgi:N-dimethylarginine dimethylaminohydrolase